MDIAVQLEPFAGSPPVVEYRWDTDTDILTARIESLGAGSGPSGSVEIEAPDGAWLILDLANGCITGVEVAVWPDVHKRPSLSAPVTSEHRRAFVTFVDSGTGPALMEVEAELHAEADDAERVIHFRVGGQREVRVVGLGRDLLLELDGQSRIAGLWLLDVPPLPST